jgi:hypothetical protein
MTTIFPFRLVSIAYATAVVAGVWACGGAHSDPVGTRASALSPAGGSGGGSSCRLDTTIVAGVKASSIAVDANNVYWASEALSYVAKSPLTGGTPATLATQSAFGNRMSKPRSITVDGTNVYWTAVDSPPPPGELVPQGNTYGAIETIPIAGASSPTAAVQGLDTWDQTFFQEEGLMAQPEAMTVRAGHVFFTSPMSAQTGAADVEVGLCIDGPCTSVQSPPWAWGPIWSYDGVTSSVVSDGTNVYWTLGGTMINTNSPDVGYVMQMPIAGGAATALATVPLVTGVTSPEEFLPAIAVNATNVYWIDVHRLANGDTTSALLTTPIGGGAVTTVASGFGATGDMAIDSANAYFVASGETLLTVPLTGGTPSVFANGVVQQASPPGSWAENGSPGKQIVVQGTNVYWVTANGDIAYAPTIASGASSFGGCCIGGQYHAAGEVDRFNSCYVCQPDVDPASWTYTMSRGCCYRSGGAWIGSACVYSNR